MKTLLPALLAVASSVAMASCSSSGCENNRNSIPMAGFYDYSTRESLTISDLEVYGVGAPNDSLLLDPVRNAHQVYLPFRGKDATASFKFIYADELANEVTFTYRSYPFFDGENCGAMWRYEITGVEVSGNGIIDSVSVTDPLITNIERERIMFFFTVPDLPAEE